MELSNKRCIQILKLLMKSKDKMTGDNLAISIGVSSRTIRNDMKELNRDLKKYGAEVISEIGQGYYLKVTQKEKFAGFLEELQRKKRKKILKILFHQSRKTGCGILSPNCCYHH